MVKTIKSKLGEISLFYDSLDEDIINSLSWVPHKDLKNGRIYFRATVKGKTILLHREIIGAFKGQIVDHINGNGADNRRCNLRIVSSSQNQMNRLVGVRGFKGLSVDNNGLYRVRLRANGKMYEGGKRFKDKEEAILKYNELSIKYHGEFANLNKIKTPGNYQQPGD